MPNLAPPQRYIGLMSGTSLDGVDAALVEITQHQITLKHFISLPLPEALKTQLHQLNLTPQVSLSQLSQLEVAVAQAFIKTTQTLIQKTHLTANDITAIGSHGQTVFHDPKIPMSYQLGPPAFIAKQTDITTVGDFRIDDMALGGQGAPLAPAFHQALLQDDSPMALVNIGGIANISFIPAKQSQTAPKGFDTGPGNGLMDEWCQTHFNRDYDKNGELAASGEVNKALLKHLKADIFFNQPTPKSTGRDKFNQTWLNSHLKEFNLSNNDVLATLNQFTAETIADAIHAETNQTNTNLKHIWICGGGASNATLLKNLQNCLPNQQIASTEKINLNPHAIEAMMCAWLAHQRIHQQPIPLKAITGATRNAVLGGIWSA